MNLKNAAAIFEFIDMEFCASDSKVKIAWYQLVNQKSFKAYAIRNCKIIDV